MSYDFNRDMNQWADIEGTSHPEYQWLLSSADTWHKNPHYTGDPQPHPEDEVGENNQEPDETPVINCSEGALVAIKDNIIWQVINYLGFDDPASNKTNQAIKDIVTYHFRTIGVVSPQDVKKLPEVDFEGDVTF
jgi:hypothetical protein